MIEGLSTPINLVFVPVLALLIFDPKRIFRMGRTLGRGLRRFV